RRRFAAADTEAGYAAFASALLQCVQQRHDNAGAAGTYWVAQGAGAAVDVDLGVIEVEVAHGDHRDVGEGFVDFEEIDVFGLPACALQCFLDRADGCGGEPARFVGVAGLRDDAGDGFEAAFFGNAFARE